MKRSGPRARVHLPIGLSILACVSACGRNGSPSSPQADAGLLPIRASLVVSDTLGRGRIEGEATFRAASSPISTAVGRISPDIIRTGRLGEPIDLGAFPAGMAVPFDIEIRGDGALTRNFRGVPLSGDTVLATDVLGLSGFDWPGFWHPAAGDSMIGPDHKNLRLNAPDLTVYWLNIRVGTLSCGGVGQVLFESSWNQAMALGAGFFRSLRFVYPILAAPPAAVFAGDVYAGKDLCLSSFGLEPRGYANPDGSLNALMIGLDSEWEDWPRQMIDALFPGSQPYLAAKRDYARFLFRRPAGDESSYRLYEDHEEQAGFAGTIAAAGAASARNH